MGYGAKYDRPIHDCVVQCTAGWRWTWLSISRRSPAVNGTTAMIHTWHQGRWMATTERTPYSWAVAASCLRLLPIRGGRSISVQLSPSSEYFSPTTVQLFTVDLSSASSTNFCPVHTTDTTTQSSFVASVSTVWNEWALTMRVVVTAVCFSSTNAYKHLDRWILIFGPRLAWTVHMLYGVQVYRTATQRWMVASTWATLQ